MHSGQCPLYKFNNIALKGLGMHLFEEANCFFRKGREAVALCIDCCIRLVCFVLL